MIEVELVRRVLHVDCVDELQCLHALVLQERNLIKNRVSNHAINQFLVPARNFESSAVELDHDQEALTKVPVTFDPFLCTVLEQ